MQMYIMRFFPFSRKDDSQIKSTYLFDIKNRSLFLSLNFVSLSNIISHLKLVHKQIHSLKQISISIPITLGPEQ